MELLKLILETFLLIGFGIFGIVWQIIQWKDKDDQLILWIRIIPLPIGLGGIVSLIIGVLDLGKLVHMI